MHRRNYKGRKFGRKSGPRKQMKRSLVSQLILHEKVSTTLSKAKEIRPIAEKIITKAKVDNVASRRQVAKFLSANDKALEKLFIELGPLYKERNGGYIRIIKTGNRSGDNTEMAILELLDTEKLIKKEVKSDKLKATSQKGAKTKTVKKTVKAKDGAKK